MRMTGSNLLMPFSAPMLHTSDSPRRILPEATQKCISKLVVKMNLFVRRSCQGWVCFARLDGGTVGRWEGVGESDGPPSPGYAVSPAAGVSDVGRVPAVAN